MSRSTQEGINQFLANKNRFGGEKPVTEEQIEKWNLYNGLANITIAIRDLGNDLEDVSRSVKTLEHDIGDIKKALKK